MLHIGIQAWEAILAHAARTAPEEACGVLAGRGQGEQRHVLRAFPCRNAHEGDRRRHFLLDPQDQIEAQRQARAAGLEILGFYHSHHNGSAALSDEDLRQAHPRVSNLILAFREGAFVEARSWIVGEEQRPSEEPVAFDDVTPAGGTASATADDR